MSYVFLDLEWNQGYPRGEADKLDEIIQIGAIRLNDWNDPGETFSAYVRPSIHKKLHHRVKQMLPLDQKELSRAAPFKRVIHDFFRWCGPAPVFFTWGGCDARVLDMNLCWYGMEEYLDTNFYDLQRAYDLFIAHTNQQASLRDAVLAMGLEERLEYHDACNDASYTALIGAEMVRRLGRLPTEEEISRGEEAFRRERHQQAVQAAQSALTETLPNLQPVVRKNCGNFRQLDECLRSRSARVFRCPECGSWLCSGNWYRVNKHFLARSRCVDHGRYYSCLSIEQDFLERWNGTVDIYDENTFPIDLFRLCKVGGTPITMTKVPKRRKRTRKKNTTLCAKESGQ